MSRLRIVVTGLAATCPPGGCYDPEQSTFEESGERGAACLARELPKRESIERAVSKPRRASAKVGASAD